MPSGPSRIRSDSSTFINGSETSLTIELGMVSALALPDDFEPYWRFRMTSSVLPCEDAFVRVHAEQEESDVLMVIVIQSW